MRRDYNDAYLSEIDEITKIIDARHATYRWIAKNIPNKEHSKAFRNDMKQLLQQYDLHYHMQRDKEKEKATKKATKKAAKKAKKAEKARKKASKKARSNDSSGSD